MIPLLKQLNILIIRGNVTPIEPPSTLSNALTNFGLSLIELNASLVTSRDMILRRWILRIFFEKNLSQIPSKQFLYLQLFKSVFVIHLCFFTSFYWPLGEE